MTARIVVLASGGGSNLQSLIDACLSGEVEARVVGVVCNRRKAYAIERCRAAEIPCTVLSLRDFETREDFDGALADAVAGYIPEVIVLAGFMHVLSPRFLDRFPAETILNLHPAYLPDDPTADAVRFPNGSVGRVYRGHNAAEQALEERAAWTGTSVHYVTHEVDRGPVLLREVVPIESDDTLRTLTARIQAVEHQMLPRAVAAHLARPRAILVAPAEEEVLP